MTNNLNYTGEILKLDGQLVTVKLYEPVNVNRLKTVFYGYDGAKGVELLITDPRKFSPQQRSFAFALMQDIYSWNGQPLDDLKEIFYFQFESLTGRGISLKKTSNNTVDDVTTLCNLILDFIFENDIPFRNYLVLPMNQNYYFFKCVENRVCCICGETGADIDHFDKALGRRKRSEVDHTEYTFAALCRTHHTMKHQIGIVQFKKKFHVTGIKLKQTTIKRLGINQG